MHYLAIVKNNVGFFCLHVESVGCAQLGCIMLLIQTQHVLCDKWTIQLGQGSTEDEMFQGTPHKTEAFLI